MDLAAYRIVQEALTNTVRHSGADKAAVTLRYEPGYVTVSVTDTGHGPPPPAAGAAPGTEQHAYPAEQEDSGWRGWPSGSRPAAAA